MLVTQPRRISAVGVATRVAQERAEQVGGVVGYSVRLDSRRSARTRLLFCTTGGETRQSSVPILTCPCCTEVLSASYHFMCSPTRFHGLCSLQCECASALPGVVLRRLLSDPVLEGVTHVVVDEVHERSADSDLLLLLLRDLLRAGSNSKLRIVLMSATAEADAFMQYFDAALDKVCCLVCTLGSSSKIQCQGELKLCLLCMLLMSRYPTCIFFAGKAGEFCFHCEHCWLYSSFPRCIFGGCSGTDWLPDWPHLQVSCCLFGHL